MPEEYPAQWHPVLMQSKVSELEEHVAKLEQSLDDLRAERAAEEKRRLKWGISALGAAVITLSGAVWALLPDTAEGFWSFLRGRQQ